MENIEIEIDYEQPDVIVKNESSVIRTNVLKDDIELGYNLETNELTKHRISTYSINKHLIDF